MHQVTDPFRLIQRGGGGVGGQAGGEVAEPVVGGGQPGRGQQCGAAGSASRGGAAWPSAADPLDDGGQPELHSLRGTCSARSQVTAVPAGIPAHPAPGLRPRHLELVRPPVLAAVAGQAAR